MAIRFTHLHLANWRNFKRVDLDLRERAFLLGPNASGKTNLLDAFQFLKDVAVEGGSLVGAVRDPRRGSLKHIRSLHAGFDSTVVVRVEVEIDGDPDRWSYELAFQGSEGRGRPFGIRREAVRHGASEVLSRPNAADQQDPRLLTQTHLQQMTQNQGFRPLAEALASVEHVHVAPQVAKDTVRATDFARHDAPGSDFISRIARLGPGQQKRKLARITRLLKIAVPQFSDLRPTRDDEGHPHLEACFQHWRRRGVWQNEQQFSDGTLRLIGLLWALDEGSAPLLLEEPELSLHKDVVRQIPRLIAAAAERTRRQVIVSTHAEELLGDRGIDPSEVVLLEPTSRETLVKPGTDYPELVAAARAAVPLGRLAVSATRPKRIEQLSLEGMR
ncbi:MAG: AAA family ATPase [Deltaproteobacteria bacterium]|nr:AAA family ATPase [Deltaproteobacteria bacterium]